MERKKCLTLNTVATFADNSYCIHLTLLLIVVGYYFQLA